METIVNPSRRFGKQLKLVQSLPKHPNKNIVWIVYNEDLVEQAENLIRTVHGNEYMDHVRVVPRSRSSKYNGSIYFDPYLYDLLGNGEM